VNDPNGCPTRLIDGKGQVLWAASYSAWGAIDKLHASAVSNPIRLQGQYEDGETGLYYNRYRYYDATAGAFLSRDPLGITPSPNCYLYGWNTQSWSDPLGLEPIKPYDIVTYGTKQSGLEMHHGILDVWASHNIPDYVSRASHNPSIALLPNDHAETKRIYRDWLEERTGKRVGGAVEWSKVSKEEVMKLSERMFDAAKAPAPARKNYYDKFTDYMKKGCRG
jgi:RHS repeat-associated protein